MKANDPRMAVLSIRDRVELIPEPSLEAKLASKAAVCEEKIRDRKPPYPILTAGTLVRTDVYGFRGHDVQVVEDPGPANLITRKVRLEKIDGRQKGDRVFVTRDRVKLSPKQ